MLKQTLQLSLIIFILAIVYTFIPVSIKNHAFAFVSNYNRTAAENTLSLDDWNELDNDFLFRDGSNEMTGNLDMGTNRIINMSMSGSPSDTDGATVGYVDGEIASMGASGRGDIITNWGSSTCPIGMNRLYQGFVFSAPYDESGGGDNPVCIESGDPGVASGGAIADDMYPMVTGADSNLPTSAQDAVSTITGDRFVPCSVCYSPGQKCYTHFGSHACTAPFTNAYDGYLLGSYTTTGGAGHMNSTERKCVNRAFDASNSAGGSMGAMWYGTRIVNNLTLGYVENAFIRCSVCCD